MRVVGLGIGQPLTDGEAVAVGVQCLDEVSRSHQQVADLVRRLGQEKVNVLLVGEAGCGKTTVLVEAVRLLERQADTGEDKSRRGRPKRRYWLRTNRTSSAMFST